MAENVYSFAMKSSGRRKLARPDIAIANWRLEHPVKYWNLFRRLSKFWLVYWNSTPGAVLKFRDRDIEMLPGKLVLIPPYTLVTAHTGQPFLHNFIEFEAGEPFNSVKSVAIEFDAAEHAPVLPPESDEVQYALALYSMVEQLLLAVPQEYFNSRDLPMFEPRIRAVLKYMNSHQMKKYSVAELAGQVNLSESRLLHLFKEETGITLRDYWQKLRMDQVVRMLENTDLSLPEIAEETGFTDRSHLSRVIKSVFGLTPVAIRRKLSGHRK